MMPLWLDVSLIVLGLLIILASLTPSTSTSSSSATPSRAQLLARARHESGLAHRLAARMIRVPRAGLADESFGDVAELYVMSRPLLRTWAPAGAVVNAGAPLLELEELLERVDRFTTRMRRRGAGRGRSGGR